MKRFKYDWLVYAIVGLACLVFGILIMPPVAVIKADKFICAIIAATLIAYFAFYIYRKYDKMRKYSKEVMIVAILHFAVIIYLIVAAILLIFDTSIIGSNNIVSNIGRIIGILLWCHGLVSIIEESHQRSNSRFGFLHIYIAIILLSLGCYCFFNVNITFETICWVLFGILMFIFLLAAIFTLIFWPKASPEKREARARKKELKNQKEEEPQN